MNSSFRSDRCAYYLFNPGTTLDAASTEHEYVIPFNLNRKYSAAEVIPSFNFAGAKGVSVTAYLQAVGTTAKSPWFNMGTWISDGGITVSSSAECDNGKWGHVETDTAVLTEDFSTLTLKLVAKSLAREPHPVLKQAGLSVYCTGAMVCQSVHVQPDSVARIQVPLRSQLEWKGGHGWCSPTSCGMVLDYWATILGNDGLSVPTPVIASRVYDALWGGTGNWTFNMAYIGSLPQMSAVALRIQSVRSLQSLLAKQVPPIVSLSYATLKREQRASDPGHLMVVTGITENGEVMLNDPYFSPGDEDGGKVVAPLSVFDEAWKRSKRLIYLIVPQDSLLSALDDCLGADNA